MREILFRGKVEDDFFSDSGKLIYKKGEWVYGYLANPDVIVGGICDMDENYISFDWWVTVDPITVGQYTGLTDKNRKKIFEGDIVRTKDGDIKKIIYKDYWGAFGVQYGLLFDKESGKHVKAHGGLSHFYGDSQFYEVIGNIHDNPELLEESK